MGVRFEGIVRRFDGVDVIHDLHLDVPDGSFTVVTGPPRSGKSVLFRTLVGLETADAGRILLNGEDIAAQSAPQRRVGYVPQSFALYPHMSVAKNIGYPMALARAPKADIASKVDWAASMLAISHLLQKTPDQLSGGEKQRVAVARGLLKEADVFVFDDPLVGLDYKLRERLMDDLRDLRKELGTTFLYGTSDSIEAMTLATRLVVLDGGRVVQHGDTESVYESPQHPRAMELIGFPRANLLDGRIVAGELQAGPLRMPVPGVAADRAADTAEVVVGVRPEAVRLVDAQAALRDGFVTLSGIVRLVEDLGSEIVVYVEVDGQMLTAVFAAGERQVPELGARTGLHIQSERIRLFDADGVRG